MRRFVKVYGIPLVSFGVATALCLVCGTGSRAVTVRAARDTTNSCSVNLIGLAVSVTPPIYQRSDIRIYSGADDPTTPPENFLPALTTAASGNNLILSNRANGDLTQEPATLEVLWRRASVLALSAGPTIVTYGRGDAFFALDITTQPFATIQFLDTYQRTANGKKIKPLKATNRGFVESILQMTSPPNISYANSQVLTMGDSVIIDVIPEDLEELTSLLVKIIDIAGDVAFEKILGAILAKLGDAVPEAIKTIIEKVGTKGLSELLEAIALAGTDFETTSKYELTSMINASQASSPFKAKLKFHYNREGERTTFLQDPDPKAPFDVSPNFLEDAAPNILLTTSVTGEGNSDAFAKGVRGSAVSGTLGLWGYTCLMACPSDPDTTPSEKWAFVRDGQPFKVEDPAVLKARGQARYFFKFNDVLASYVMIFDKATATADMQMRKNQPQAAEQTLHQMQLDLSQLLNGIKGTH